ncbi:MAG: endonuclease III domain-containing protein [Thermodesulfobacteriota bacterium]
MEFYEALYNAFGPQKWWPARTRIEVIVGAILTQNTAWSNVEKAVRELKKARLLSVEGLVRVDTLELARLIRPSGYFNVKAGRLKNFISFLSEDFGGSVSRLFGISDTKALRRRILSVNGIGPETADSILLYAGRRAEFVVDAYTKRVFSRHGLLDEKAGYEEVKALFMEGLPQDAGLFNEYHALIVRVGKDFCRPRRPLCGACPLKAFLGS